MTEILVPTRVDFKKVLENTRWSDYCRFWAEEVQKGLMSDFMRGERLRDGIHSLEAVVGILHVEAEEDTQTDLALSAGIHGDETGPILVVDKLVEGICNENIRVRNNVMFILGNLMASDPRPNAYKKEYGVTRFLDYNLNRLFTDEESELDQVMSGYEFGRAEIIKKMILEILSKGSLLIDAHQTPKPEKSSHHTNLDYTCAMMYGDDPLIKWLVKLLAIDTAVVYPPNQKAATLAGYAVSQGFYSTTLELGECGSIYAPQLFRLGQITSELIEGKKLEDLQNSTKFKRLDGQPDLENYTVLDQPIKRHESFQFAQDYKDFSVIEGGDVWAYENGKSIVAEKRCRILFPIAGAKIGQRVCVLVSSEEDKM